MLNITNWIVISNISIFWSLQIKVQINVLVVFIILFIIIRISFYF